MDSLYVIVIFCIFTECHGKAEEAYKGSVNCNRHNSSEELFSCIYGKYHKEKRCMKIIKKFMQSALHSSPTNECLAGRSKFRCKKCYNNENCIKETCKEFLSFCIESLRKQRSENSGKNGNRVTTINTRNNTLHRNTDNRKDYQNCDDDKGSVTDDGETSTIGKENGKENDKKDKRKKGKEKLFQLGAIVGISVGPGTIILFFVILMTFFIFRRRSKKKQRKQHTRQQSIDQRLGIIKYESGSFSTNKGGYNVLSANIPLVADEAQAGYCFSDTSITKYDKDLSNRKLPDIKRCNNAEDDDNVYYEIDEDQIKSSKDIEGVHQRKIKEVAEKSFYHSDQTGYEIPLVSMKKMRQKLTKQQSIDKKSEIASLESSPTSSNNGANTILFANESLNTDEAQGNYFVLDPSVRKNDKNLSCLVLPEIKIFSVAQDDERVYNEIDEDEIQPPTDMEVVHQRKIEEAKDKCSYNGDQNTYETSVSKKNNTEQRTRQKSVDQETGISHL